MLYMLNKNEILRRNTSRNWYSFYIQVVHENECFIEHKKSIRFFYIFYFFLHIVCDTVHRFYSIGDF